MGFISITITIDGDSLLFLIANSKPKEKNAIAADLPGGIGLENVKKRLNLLYPSQFSLETLNTENEYIVNLKLQLINEFKPEYHEMLNN